MKRLQIPQKLVYEKFYIHEKILHKRNYRRKFAKFFSVKNAKKTCKPNKRDLHSITCENIQIFQWSKRKFGYGERTKIAKMF